MKIFFRISKGKSKPTLDVMSIDLYSIRACYLHGKELHEDIFQNIQGQVKTNP